MEVKAPDRINFQNVENSLKRVSGAKYDTDRRSLVKIPQTVWSALNRAETDNNNNKCLFYKWRMTECLFSSCETT